MKENEKFLKESIDLLSREFGQPLPTISSVMKKHQEQEVNKIKQEVNKIETVNEITLPGAVKRHMDKLVGVLQDSGLNRQKQLLVLALIVDALGIDASQLTVLMQKVKKTMGESVVLETPAAIAAAAASTVLHSPKGRDVKVSTALKDKEHPLHKRALNWVKSKMKKKDEPKKQSKSDSDFYRKQYEGKVNEVTQKQEIQTEFGRFKIVHGENPTGPGYDQQYFLEVNLNNKYLGHFMIEGDPQEKGGKFKISIHKGFKQVGIK